MSELIFMRHGEHAPNDGNSDLFSDLTSVGCDEMRLVGRTLGKRNINKAYTVNNDRSLGSVTLVLNPMIPNDAIAEESGCLVAEGRVGIDDRFQYLKHVNHEFQESLDEAFFAGNCLRFFVKGSDRFSGVSTYSTMAATVADTITEYANSLLCLREFFYPSFRAKMTHLKLGEKMLMHYVDYYCSEVEWNPNARTQTQLVERSGSTYRLTDRYGHLIFNNDDIMTIKEGLYKDD